MKLKKKNHTTILCGSLWHLPSNLIMFISFIISRLLVLYCLMLVK